MSLLCVAALAVTLMWKGWAASDQPVAAPGASEVGRASEQRAVEAYGQLPLRFEPNQGQTDRRVRFLSRGAGYSLFLTDREAVLSLAKAAPVASGGDPAAVRAAGAGVATATVRIRPVGGNSDARVSAAGRQPGHSNYMSGNDPSEWRRGVPGFGRVSYRDVYPGIDLVYYGKQRQLEYDFVVAPGADPGQIALDMQGAEGISLDRRGDLVLRTGAGSVRQQKPLVYQRAGGEKRQVEGRYVLEGKHRVGFSLGAYDRSRPLVIDPVLVYSTYLGGNKDGSPENAGDAGNTGDDYVNDVAVADGCASQCATYVAGQTAAPDFPLKDAYQSEAYVGSGDPQAGVTIDNRNSGDAFVTKLDASGSALVYSTYLGGHDSDGALGIAVDGSGSAYVTGSTSSGGYLPSDSCQPDCRGFPMKNPMRGFGGGVLDAFVTKLDPSGRSLAYSTFLGGANDDIGNSLALAPGCVSNCEAYLGGDTTSPDFPTKDPVQPLLGQGKPDAEGFSPRDAFATKLNAAGSALVYSTYLGGAEIEQSSGVDVDGSGNAYLTGSTRSTDFPTKNAYQQSNAGVKPFDPKVGVQAPGSDAFVTKLSTAGSALVYSTYLGGSTSGEGGRGIAVDGSGSAYVTGSSTPSTNFPTANPAPSPYDSGNTYVTKFNPSDGASPLTLSYSTFLAGVAGTGIAVDALGSAYVTGVAGSADFPTKDPFQSALGGKSDAFVTTLDPNDGTSPVTVRFASYLGGASTDTPNGIALDCSGGVYLAGATSSADFPTRDAFQSALRGGEFDGFVAKVSPVAPRDCGSGGGGSGGGGSGGGGSGGGGSGGSGGGSSGGSGSSSGSGSGGPVIASGTGGPQQGGPGGSGDPGGGAGIPGVGPVASPVDRGRARGLRRCLRSAPGRAARRRCLARFGRTPGRVKGLRARALSTTSVLLSFRAAGTDRNRGPAAQAYLVKQSLHSIRGRRDFARARPLCNRVCRFSVTRVGASVKLTITDLRPSTRYYYAVAARDNVSGRLGPRSRVSRARTR